MLSALDHSLIAVATIAVLEVAVIARILIRPHRDPASRIAWLVVVVAVPLLGMLAYLRTQPRAALAGSYPTLAAISATRYECSDPRGRRS